MLPVNEMSFVILFCFLKIWKGESINSISSLEWVSWGQKLVCLCHKDCFSFVCVSLCQTAMLIESLHWNLAFSRHLECQKLLLKYCKNNVLSFWSWNSVVKNPHWVSMAQFKYAYHAHSLAGSNSREHGHHEHPGSGECGVWRLAVSSAPHSTFPQRES